MLNSGGSGKPTGAVRGSISRRTLIRLSAGVVCSSWFSSFCVGQSETESNNPTPNDRFRVAVVRLPSAQVSMGVGGPINESLFITDKAGKPVVEFSDTFRKTADNAFPKYQVFWSGGGGTSVSTAVGVPDQSSQVAGVAQFRRNAAIAAFVRDDQNWEKLDLPELDPSTEARAKVNIKPTENGTFEWEITQAKWDPEGIGLLIDVIVSFKTPVVAQVAVSYHLQKVGSKWITNSTATVEAD
jgi:hypothetical protein